MVNVIMYPANKKSSDNSRFKVLIGTAGVLIFAFFAIIALFFVFSLFSSSVMGKCVAVVDIDMELTTEGAEPSLFSYGVLGSEEMASVIRNLNERDDVGAIVFVINSPGGSVVATREVYDAVQELDKPKVSYFREVAASGAYYVATGTDYIISDPDALTGSIGVIATFTQMGDLFEKLGVNVTSVTSGNHKDMGSSYRNMTQEERQIFQNLVDEVYAEFRGVVLENRRGKLDMAKFDEVTDGRILTGRQAVAVGLVDELGTKRDAILKAAELAGMPEDSIDDVSICPISTNGEEGGLFSAEAFINLFKMASNKPSLNYK